VKKIPKVLLCIIFLIIACNISYAQKNIDGFKTYLIKKGDILGKIAPMEHWDIIQRVNRIDEKHLPLGKEILIPNDIKKALRFCPVPEVIKDAVKLERVIYFFLDIQYFGAYEQGKLMLWGPISSGRKGKKDYSTPEGNFNVIWKAKKYFSKRYQASMPYAVNFSATGYFFHQQSLPGRPASHGCIRLLRSDAKTLFYWIKKNDIIIVTRIESLRKT